MKPRHPHTSPPLSLAYCTNIHPAESWDESLASLGAHTLRVRDLLGEQPSLIEPFNTVPFGIGLRLSARASLGLLEDNELARFRDWLEHEECYVFTINGFPYGDFHGTRVKEQVYRPDWTTPERLEYTKQLFTILSEILPPGIDGSVSTLPGSFKTFGADESLIIGHLIELAEFLDVLSERSDRDLHLGLEPEPLGLFENTAQTLRFFDRLLDAAPDHGQIKRRIGINYDCCHFAIEFDKPRPSLDVIAGEGLRLSKIHLSNALEFDPSDPAAIDALHTFDEKTYLHQVILRHADDSLTRFLDLPEFLDLAQPANSFPSPPVSGRVHFHIPLDATPREPLLSTRSHVLDTLAWHRDHPGVCTQFEIETYTWGVLPHDLQRPVEEQIADEYRWVIQNGLASE
jgi:hypothetical protein